MKHTNEQQSGFTRTDLVAVVAIVVALSALTFPLRGDYESDSAKLVCHSNMRQLTRATHLYTMDNGGFLPLNGSDSIAGRIWVGGNGGASESTNSAALSNPSTSLLANYLERRIRPFKCPADPSVTVIGNQRVPHVRSVSMNGAVGTNPTAPKSPTPGSWLDGSFGHTANRTWRCFAKMSDFVRPVPSQTYIFLEEHPAYINDGYFGCVGPGPLSQKVWVDLVAAYHQGGASFGMADGSALTHRWIVPVTAINNPIPPPISTSIGDLNWLSEHTTAPITAQP